MNLLEFNEKISYDKEIENNVNPSRFFSEQVTMFNILNGFFPEKDILNIRITKTENPTFAIAFVTEKIAECAEENLNGQIIPGAYKPLYKLDVTRNDNTLFFRMEEV